MIKYFLGVLGIALMISCVSPKVYKDLESKYNTLKDQNRQLSAENDALTSAKNKSLNDLKALQKEYDEAVAQRDKLQADYQATKTNLDNLKASYDALEKNSSASIAENAQKNREIGRAHV